ncbi:MAG TPA: hypothetical protein VMY78_13450 [Solirubrobacteraceae bacterium]|nr:hypothetical protein [Solirubrobacteraceae bacterium]
MGPDRYFILIYDIPSRQLEVHEFEERYEDAVEAYGLFESKHRKDRAVEVVLVGADSIQTIHKTHSHYFAEHADDLFRQFLDGAASPPSPPGVVKIQAAARRRRRP